MIIKRANISTPKLKIEFAKCDRSKENGGLVFDFTGPVNDIGPEKEGVRYADVRSRKPGRAGALREQRLLRRTPQLKALVVAVGLFVWCALCAGPARAAVEAPPQVAASDAGARIDEVTIDAYGITNPQVATRYLSLHIGDALTQAGVDHDYANLANLAYLHPRLQIEHRPNSAGVALHWIALGKWFAATDHPFYGDQPLTLPIEGFGSVFTSAPLDATGLTVSSYTQIALRAQLARILVTKPLWVDAARGREGDLIVNELGLRGDYRADQPVTQEVYSWLQGPEALYLDRGTNGTQVEVGFRLTRATSAKPTFIAAPSLQDTFYTAGRSTTFEAGLSNQCAAPRTQWYPPNCYLQYRVEAFDSIGGLGANSTWHSGFVDLASYNRVGSSTFVFHGAVNRSGGTIPTSNLNCAYTFGYAKSLCGTDSNLLQAELRLADARPGPLKFIVFTETAAARVRGSDVHFAPSHFFWRGDEGVGLAYRGFRFNLAYGTDGGRITYEVVGQLF